jgi:two-component system sensor histidine kinase RpfC
VSTAPSTPRDRRSRIREVLVQLRGRPDSEHEMSFNRMFMLVATLIYIVLADHYPEGLPVSIAYTVVSIIAFVHILIDPAVRVWRRLAMMVIDVAGLSFLMYANGVAAAGFWPLYLWVIFGNGFRFGNSYLFATALLSIACFSLVIAMTPFWRANMALSIGLVIGLIILPAYAAQLVGKLSKAKREAEEASRAKSYFLASVSHELRTPLTAIIGLGEQLQGSDLPSEDRNNAGTIVTAGRSLLSLINQLLDFSRLGAKGITTETKTFHLMPLLVSVRELMKISAQEKGLRLTIHVSPRTPLMLRGDQPHLRDVLTNLIGNAIKFTPAGAITISADAERLPNGDIELILSVTDTGIGIAAEAQEHIFDSFRQADNSIIDRFGGTGLGLAICKQVAELMGGRIGVESAPGQGSRFWFTARVEDASDEQPPLTADSRQLILFSSDADLVDNCRATLAPIGISVSSATSFDAVRNLASNAPSGTANAIMVDERELKRQAVRLETLREALDHGVTPIFLRRAPAPVEPDRAVERAFITTIASDLDFDELATALRIATAASPTPLAPAPVQQIEVAERPLRVLIADDNVMNQKVFGMILTRAGHQIETAGDGEAALDIMKEHAVDVVLMDVNMPALNGIETTKLYRFASLGRRHIPIIGVTADASPQTAERCIEAGMDACISKPVDAPAMLRLIDGLTREAAQPLKADAVFDPKGVVTPLFPDKRAETVAIDWSKLADLKELGGDEFVIDLLNEYVSDAENLLRAIADSVATSDVQGFRDGTHALRSSGANIGAETVARLCLHFQRIGREEFAARGAQHVETLRHELERVRQALAERQSRPIAAQR